MKWNLAFRTGGNVTAEATPSQNIRLHCNEKDKCKKNKKGKEKSSIHIHGFHIHIFRQPHHLQLVETAEVGPTEKEGCANSVEHLGGFVFEDIPGT